MTPTRVNESIELKYNLRNHVVEYKEAVLHQLKVQRAVIEQQLQLQRREGEGEEKKQRIASKRTATTAVTDGIGTSLKRIRSSSSSTSTSTTTPFRVVRTAIPPQRYVRNEKEEQEEGIKDLLVLKPREIPLHDSTRPHSTPPSASTEYINTVLDQKLHHCIQLQRQIHRKRQSITRKRQLPRTSLPFRSKSHWDVVLEEMKWMAMDFTSERNWKRILQYQMIKEVILVQNQEKIQKEVADRQAAKEIATQISTFWRTMERMAVRSRLRLEKNSTTEEEEEEEEEKKKERVDSMDGTVESIETMETISLLQFKRVVVVPLAVEEGERMVLIERVKNQVQTMVNVGKHARDAVKSGKSISPQHEEAIQQVLSSQSTVLATFQLVAIRWMMELCCSGWNVSLNDQLGMAKAATITAFIRVMDVFQSSPVVETAKPHLFIVPCDEVHKWAYHVRQWIKKEEGIVQMYNGSCTQRLRLQREWTRKRNVEGFMVDLEVEELEKEEKIPLYCCIVPISLFLEDSQVFLAFSQWQMVIVEKSNEYFEDMNCIQTLQQIPQQQQRILCCDQPLETWKNNTIREEYACFLVEKRSWKEIERQVWTCDVVLERTSVLEMGKYFNSLKNQSESVNASVLVLYWFSLRRIRSEVESELSKIEEQSIVCTLSHTQRIQYQQTISTTTTTTIETWLLLCLQLRRICNGIEIINDIDKLILADMEFLFKCSSKLQSLYDLVLRLVVKESKRIVIYCQLETMLTVLEIFLNRIDISYVRLVNGKGITEEEAMLQQQRSLCHFALEPSVQVALTSTRLSCENGKRAMPIYGADAIIVFDSDWNPMCDAKLRASWTVVAAGYSRGDVAMYRLCCEETIESSLLRIGSCMSEKIFTEFTPMELIYSTIRIEKPSWWCSTTNFYSLMKRMEIESKYIEEEGISLEVVNVELDTEEHLLVSNNDDLLPIEWYAVDYIHNTESKRTIEYGIQESIQETPQQTFEEMICMERKQQWQDQMDSKDLFYTTDIDPTELYAKGVMLLNTNTLSSSQEAMLLHFLSQLRRQGMDTYYNVVSPPIPPITTWISSDSGSIDAYQMMFHILYRIPPPIKRMDSTSVLIPSGETKLKVKKRDKNGIGVKRKLDSLSKEEESILLPDVSEFTQDDEFWGDTNLDALDSASWDDTAVLGNILGTSLDSSPIPPSSSSSSINTTSNTKKKNKSTTATTTTTTITGRSRKGSISDGGKEGWNVHDDILLKKLYEVYGSNWTLIAQVFNTMASISRFVVRKRTARQCYDRYGKVVAGVVSGSASTVTGTPPTKEAKSAMIKQQKLATVTAAMWTSDVVAQRIGIPESEMVLMFNVRDSLPGIPPPLMNNGPTVVELSLVKKKKKQQSTIEGNTSTIGNGLDDFKSIRASFEAIIQSMKHKTPPPPIPIPQPVTDTTIETSTSTPSNTTSPSLTTPVITTIPRPHKSHHDLVAMLPRVPLAPNDVIKRIKEAAAVAVHAAATSAMSSSTVGVGMGVNLGVREVSPLSAAGDVMMGATFGSAAMAARKAQHASLAAARAAAVSQGTPSTTGPGMKPLGPLHTSVPSPSVVSPAGSSAWGDTPPTPVRSTTIGVPGSALTSAGVQQQHLQSMNLSSGEVVQGSSTTPSSSIPVSTSALLHVLDRMPEIKNKIQAILNRTDCSEAQKVAMIARLLSNTNAINASGASSAASTSLPASHVSGTTFVGTTSTPMDTLTPIPMPPSLANESTSTSTTTTIGSDTTGSTTTNTNMDVG